MKIEESLRDYHPRNTMKSLWLLLLAFFSVVLFQASPVHSIGEQILHEVPGYAKRMMGTFGGEGVGLVGQSYRLDRPYYSFRSIRYAAPPIKENRFLPPNPRNYPYPNDEIYNAVEASLGCPQNGRFETEDEPHEDCLFLSVYTPYLPGINASYPTNMPVNFWIHGGGFVGGHSIEYLPNTWMDYDVVTVVVQYRMGALGFLSLDTDEVPGNAGIFDQIEALRWVNKFIQYFGGNPNKVTVFGESAGAASTSLLLLAPQARGLFHHAIAESGSMLTDWAIDRNGKNSGMTIVEYANCPTEPYRDTLNCLRNIDVRTLLEAQRRLSREDSEKGGLGYLGQCPVIQNAGQQRLLEREPKDIIEEGDYATEVKIMFGANKHEGIFVANVVYGSFILPNDLENDEDFLRYEIVPTLLNAMGVEDDTGVLADVLYDKYFSYAVEAGQETNFTYLMPGFVDLGGVLFLKSGGWETVRLHSKHNPGNAYWYSFDFRGRYQLLGRGYEFIPPGVGHADEIMYLWLVPFPHNETEETVRLRMVETWANFIQFGDPSPNENSEALQGVPKFLPYDDKNKHFMAINDEWELRKDYTNYYTVSVDDAFPDRKYNAADYSLFEKTKEWYKRNLKTRKLAPHHHKYVPGN